MSFLNFLGGGDEISTQHGVDINKGDFDIKNADQLFGQTQDQYSQAAAQQPNLINQSNQFLNTLQQSANGQGPSLAAATMRQNQDRNLQQQLAMAGAQRGGNTAAMQRELLRSQSAGNANVAQQGMLGALQEQQQNRALYGNQLQAQQSSVNQATQNYLQQGFGIRQAQEQALADYNHLNVQQALGLAQINQKGEMAQQSAFQSGLGRALGAVSGGAGMAGQLFGEGSSPTPPFAAAADSPTATDEGVGQKFQFGAKMLSNPGI